MKLWIGLGVVWIAEAALPPVIPGDSQRGAKLFETQRCVQCHSVNGKGGKVGMDLGARVDRGFTPAMLAVAMWNHAPVMWAAMEGTGIERPRLSPDDAADLFAYLYSTRFFDKPGDAARGKAAFAERHCAECHGITESKAEGAPPVVKWESLGEPMVLAQQMWDHSSSMREAFARRKIAWQELTAQDLTDILAYLRNLPQTASLAVRFSFTSGEGGQAIFEAKGCVKCHTGKLALEDRLHNLTLTEIAVDMWNHAPRMIQPVPQLSASVRAGQRRPGAREASLHGQALRELSYGRGARRAGFARTGASLFGSDDHVGVVEAWTANVHAHAAGENSLAAVQQRAATDRRSGVSEFSAVTPKMCLHQGSQGQPDRT
jgi:mono/diheme cytochrome c family protein